MSTNIRSTEEYVPLTVNSPNIGNDDSGETSSRWLKFTEGWVEYISGVHKVTAIVWIDIVYTLYYVGLFAVSFLAGESGTPSPGFYVLSAIPFLLFGAVVTALVPHKALLFGQYVYGGTLFCSYFVHSGHVSFAVTDLFRVFPFLVMTAVFVFFMGPMVTLLDMRFTNLLLAPPSALPSSSPLAQMGELEDSGSGYSYGSELSSLGPTAVKATVTTILRNYCTFFFSLYLGLHWAYAPQLFHVRVELDPASIAHWGAAQFIAVPVGVTLGLGVLIFHARIMWRARKRYVERTRNALPSTPQGSLTSPQYTEFDEPSDPAPDFGSHIQIAYICLYGGVVVYMVMATLAAKAVGEVFHVHHYFLMLLLTPLTRFRHPLSALCQGFFVAVHMDGMIRFGMASLWEEPNANPAPYVG